VPQASLSRMVQACVTDDLENQGQYWEKFWEKCKSLPGALEWFASQVILSSLFLIFGNHICLRYLFRCGSCGLRGSSCFFKRMTYCEGESMFLKMVLLWQSLHVRSNWYEVAKELPMCPVSDQNLMRDVHVVVISFKSFLLAFLVAFLQSSLFFPCDEILILNLEHLERY